MAHRVQQRPQRFSEWGNSVHNSRWCIRINRTFNDSGALQFAELLGEGSLRNSIHCALQFRKPLGVFEELLENRGLPAAAENAGGGFHRTKFWALSHKEPGYTLYTTYRMDATGWHITLLPPSSSILTTTESAPALGRPGELQA
jgi:hypothetical protein